MDFLHRLSLVSFIALFPIPVGNKHFHEMLWDAFPPSKQVATSLSNLRVSWCYPHSKCFFVSFFFLHRQTLRCNSVRDYLPSVFSQRKGRQFAFKVAHSLFLGGWCWGCTVRPGEEQRHPWIHKNTEVVLTYLLWWATLVRLISSISHSDGSNLLEWLHIPEKNNMIAFVRLGAEKVTTAAGFFLCVHVLQIFIFTASWPFPEHHCRLQ